MSDLIRVLPDVVANQIAAGEVIQRPASVVKELMENAVDAGAGQIQVILKDAGRSLIQIVDNGCGMSGNDARLSFERHATSKIQRAEDLFSIRTMGFRGEALASIASIAQVELKTKRAEDENGTHIRIEGSELIFQQPVACRNGTSLAVKNLFYNVPARRRFLKSNSTELRHILTEFQRIALTHPDITFTLHHQDSELFHLGPSGLRERIVKTMGRSIDPHLVTIHTETSIVTISGFIGKPEKARKTYGEQFFFVNNRFMKHPYLHKAVVSCYESLLPPDSIPSYFIYLETDPSHIDINIHPTKTEIKFDEERAVFQILQASVKEGLGRFNVTPSLDFNQDGAIEIPVGLPDPGFRIPDIPVNPGFNPFEADSPALHGSTPAPPPYRHRPEAMTGWEGLYPEPAAGIPEPVQKPGVVQLKGKYLLTPSKSGLLIIHIRRALERIYYEQYRSGQSARKPAQKLLYPVHFEVNASDLTLIDELKKDLEPLGFELEVFGKDSVIIHGIPSEFQNQNTQEVIEQLIEEMKQQTRSIETAIREKLARTLSVIAARTRKEQLNVQEIQQLIDQLFSCQQPQTTADGKKIMTILQQDEIDQRF